MIGSLRGTVLDRAIGGEVLLEVGGVGYRVAVPSGAVAALEPGEPAFLFTHLLVREDALSLYGFPDREQRDTFEALMSASGVGPKLALAILSIHTPSALRRVVVEGDLDALTLVPGVGKRTAQRLMIELSAKLGTTGPELTVIDGGAPSGRAEMRAALEGLGYGTEEVRYVLDALPDDGPVEVLLKEALKLLAVDRAPAGAPAKRPVLNGNGKRRA
ncbi:MAG TPA: Holliday junction branch migration protein RuvA [Acidimicrobiia bacterium]|nr:Holliday junction branch migration protein RuvA [Acidimicrobiia bacterium]